MLNSTSAIINVKWMNFVIKYSSGIKVEMMSINCVLDEWNDELWWVMGGCGDCWV